MVRRARAEDTGDKVPAFLELTAQGRGPRGQGQRPRSACHAVLGREGAPSAVLLPCSCRADPTALRVVVHLCPGRQSLGYHMLPSTSAPPTCGPFLHVSHTKPFVLGASRRCSNPALGQRWLEGLPLCFHFTEMGMVIQWDPFLAPHRS